MFRDPAGPVYGDDLGWVAVDIDKDADQVGLAVKHNPGLEHVAARPNGMALFRRGKGSTREIDSPK